MNPNKNRLRGKRNEKALAKKLGCDRVGIFGKEDLKHSKYSFECKSRKTFVADSWMGQAIKNCPEGKIPILIVHKLGKHHDNDLIIMRLSDFTKEMLCQENQLTY